MTPDAGPSFSELPTRYDPLPVERRWYESWLAGNYFHSTPTSGKKSYTIVIPPPNVTGALHMGHALNNTLQDILIRWRRMQGHEALWIPGTDHAGVATQTAVEKMVHKEEKKTRHDLGREELLRRIWAWKEKYGERILLQLRKLGSSCDWSRARFTMDEGLSKAVRQVFVRLFRQGLIYRGRYLVNWCPALQTALADDEVEYEETNGHLWHFRYPILGQAGRFVTVATTRPETMLGDTAVAVHPEDERYRDLIGKKILLPLVSREIPVIADWEVDRAFGTGAVKVTPAHDPTDYRIGQRHQLPQINILNPDGTINENGGRFSGMPRFKARDAVVDALSQEGLLEKIEPHVHNVGHCYRTGDVIEPYLSLQWFVKMRPLADLAMAATRDGKVRFHPERYTDFYMQWLENVRDWCISRQIWWGHRIPIWYGPDGTAFSGLDEAEARAAAAAHYGKAEQEIALNQDEDVLDTWFSSALWPFSTLGWPDQTRDLEYYFPTNTLVTDRGIIFFWVARMVMMSEILLGKEPFSDVYIHGTILDREGRKMSKSRGNGIDPVALIDGGVDENTRNTYEPHGADAVRFSLATLSMEGQDLRLWPERFEEGRGFANKLWNAGRFVLQQLAGGENAGSGPLPPERLQFEDRWILSRLTAAVQETTEALEKFQYCLAAQRVRDFVWNDFCDWYVELVKFRLSGKSAGPGKAVDPEDAKICRQVLAAVFDATLRLLHPVCPFITEELWHLLDRAAPRRGIDGFERPSSEMVMQASWPAADGSLRRIELEKTFSRTQEAIKAVRRIRQERNLSAKDTPEVHLDCAGQPAADAFESQRTLLENLGSMGRLRIGVLGAQPENSVSELIADYKIYIPVPKTNIEKERQSVLKQIAEKEVALQREEQKLQNPLFVEKAPPAVVEAARKRNQEQRRQLEALRKTLKDFDKTCE